MDIKKNGKFVALVLFLASSSLSCQKKSDADDSGKTAETKTDDTNTDQTNTESGVTENDGETVAVTGSLALAIALTEGELPDSLLAIPIEAGEFQYSQSYIIKAAIDTDGKFELKLAQKSKNALLLDKGLKADDTIDRTYIESILPEAAKHSDEDLVKHIKEQIVERDANPEKFEVSYVIVAYKASGDKVAEANSMRFIGMPTDASPLLGLPITKSKGNLNFGKVKIEGELGTSELKADTTSFDLSLEALKGMTTANDALKTLKNIYINTDLDTAKEVAITPTFNWKTSMAELKAGTSEPKNYTFKGYSSYIAPRNHAISLDNACQSDEASRLIFEVYPPEPQTSSVETGSKIYDSSTPITSAGSVNKALASENGGDRKSCGVGSAYFAGDDAEGLSQIGMINFDNLPPNGWWKLKKAGDDFATFDLGLSNPVAADGSIKMFVPKVTMEITDGNISKLVIKFFVWDAASSSYQELSDLSPFKRIMTEFGLSVNRYNENGGSSEAGGSRPGTIEGNAYVITNFVDQGGAAVTIADPSAEATKGSLFIYYRAFGNSYNFFWEP